MINTRNRDGNLLIEDMRRVQKQARAQGFSSGFYRIGFFQLMDLERIVRSAPIVSSQKVRDLNIIDAHPRRFQGSDVQTSQLEDRVQFIATHLLDGTACPKVVFEIDRRGTDQ